MLFESPRYINHRMMPVNLMYRVSDTLMNGHLYASVECVSPDCGKTRLWVEIDQKAETRNRGVTSVRPRCGGARNCCRA